MGSKLTTSGATNSGVPNSTCAKNRIYTVKMKARGVNYIKLFQKMGKYGNNSKTAKRSTNSYETLNPFCILGRVTVKAKRVNYTINEGQSISEEE